jgi:isochorismate pyruvate lyase
MAIDLNTVTTMDELRREIDILDRQLVGLLARRSAMIDHAVTLKRAAGLPARINARVEAVISNVRAAAGDAGLDPDLPERIWRELIEWSIAREDAALCPTQGDAVGGAHAR